MKNIYIRVFLMAAFLSISFSSSASSPVAVPTNVFSNGDFESGNLSGWNILSGTAFSNGDVTNQNTYWGGTFNQQGSYHLWSFNIGGDADVGSLTSGKFIVGGDVLLRFKISGGDDLTNLYVALCDSNGNEINGFKAGGHNSESYSDVTWNLTALLGQTVFLKIVDNATGNWGHLNLDAVRIPTSNFKRPENLFSNGNFETGNLAGWNLVEGTAFSNADVTTDATFWDNQPFSAAGLYHLWSYKSGGDADIGLMTSGLFRLGGNGIIHFKVSGGNDINKLYVALMDPDNREIPGFKATGTNSEKYHDVYWDASSYIGKVLYFKVVDTSTEAFGHINLDNVEFTNTIYPTNSFSNGNFEVGSLLGWNVLEGDAFTDDQVTSCESANYPAFCQFGDPNGKEGIYHFYGKFARYGHDDHTSASGIMTSGNFIVAGTGTVKFKIGGTNDSINNYIALFDLNGNELIGTRRTGHGNSIYRDETLNLSSHIGETLFFVVVDNKPSSGFINLDAITLP